MAVQKLLTKEQEVERKKKYLQTGNCEPRSSAERTKDQFVGKIVFEGVQYTSWTRYRRSPREKRGSRKEKPFPHNCTSSTLVCNVGRSDWKILSTKTFPSLQLRFCASFQFSQTVSTKSVESKLSVRSSDMQQLHCRHHFANTAQERHRRRRVFKASEH